MLNQSFFIQAIWISIPLLFGCLGTIYSEKSGMLNLGTEGIMMTSAVFSFLGAYGVYEASNNVVLAAIVGVICGMIAGVLLNMIYAVITIVFKANQTVTGLTLATLGIGIGNFIGKANNDKTLPISISEVFRGHAASGISIPVLSKIPFIGSVLFTQNLFFYIAIILVILSWIYFTKTRPGLYVKAVGDNPGSAESMSINVNKYKFIHLIIAGAIISLAGSFFMLGYNNTKWLENVSNGYGWIAIALVIFSSWKPGGALLGSVFFGALLLSFTLKSNPALAVIFSKTYIVLIILVIISLCFIIYFKSNNKSNWLTDIKDKLAGQQKILRPLLLAFTAIGIGLLIFGYKINTLMIIGIIIYSVAMVAFCLYKPMYALAISVILFYVILCIANKDYLKMAPYVSTVLVLSFISARKKASNRPPQSLGIPYFREER
ncbi:MAG: ABC transporter permease [Bacilli bacterium]